MTDLERAYLAGLIDGEGSITLTVFNKGQLPQPQLSISNNNLQVLEWVKQKVGCGSIIRKKPRRLNHSISYSWQVHRAGRVISILEKIIDYLIIKEPQANLILKKYLLCTPRNGKYTNELFKQKQLLVEEIRKLNQR